MKELFINPGTKITIDDLRVTLLSYSLKKGDWRTIESLIAKDEKEIEKIVGQLFINYLTKDYSYLKS